MLDQLPHNRLLAQLSEQDQGRLAPRLEPVDLPVGRILEESDVPEEYAYFPFSGVASTVGAGTRGRKLEVGLFGREGMSGTAIVMQSSQTPLETFMQVAGEGVRIRADDLHAAIIESGSLQKCLLSYVQAQHIQVVQTAVSNGYGKLEERLARWLVMCRDRVSSDHFYLTHKFLAQMLCVRRAGVTVALHELEGRGLIRAEREHLTIRDREGLVEAADGSYGLAEREYERLLN